MTQIRVLIVEDSDSDAALVVRALERAELTVEALRVDTADELRDALSAQLWDVVISDFNLPQFDARDALALLHETGLDVPFIVVSGTIGEETAVGLMKAGAQDYLKKESLTRLAPVVKREVAEARQRALHREAQSALRKSEARFETVVEQAPAAIFIQAERRFVYVNLAAQRLFGAAGPGDLLGKPILELFHPDDHLKIVERMRQLNEERRPVAMSVHRAVRLDGAVIYAEVSAVPFEHAGQPGALVFARDITERIAAEASVARQVEELRRWHDATLGRESRILELKREVNELLVEAGGVPRYSSVDGHPAEPSKPR